MKCRIDIEVDPKQRAVGAVVNGNVQVFDRAQRQVACRNAMTGKAEFVVERHHVDADAEQAAAVDLAADIVAQVRQLIALVLQVRTKPLRCLIDHIGNRHAGLQREPQRQHVRRHAGDAPRTRAPRRHRHADHDVVGAREAMEEHRRRRGHDASERRSAANSQCAQRDLTRTRYVSRCAQESPGLLDGRLLNVRLPASGRAAKAPRQ